MSKTLKRTLTVLATYAIVGLLFYGWTWNHQLASKCWTDPEKGDLCWVSDQVWARERTNMAVTAGVLWPVLTVIMVGMVSLKFVGDAAIFVTRWP